jgi:hypothetical protein
MDLREGPMLQDGNGNFRHVTVNEAERLHHFPPGWTASTKADEKTRLRLLGNSWHADVAKLMWIIVVLCPTMPNATTSIWSTAAPPCRASNDSHPFRSPPLRERK